MKGQQDVATPAEYLAKLDEPRRSEIGRLDEFIRETVPDLRPFIQSGMLAYGKYHYKYASGREGDWCVVALASNKNYISLYVCAADDTPGKYLIEQNADRLGKVNVGKGCIRFKKTDDLDLTVVAELLRKAELSQKSSLVDP